jgi:hypothetical protein
MGGGSHFLEWKDEGEEKEMFKIQAWQILNVDARKPCNRSGYRASKVANNARHSGGERCATTTL